MSLTAISTPIAPPLLPVVQLLQAMFDQVHELPDARRVERTVHQALKVIERQTMEICIQDKARQAIDKDVREVRCPHCAQGWAARLEPAAARYAETVRGRVDYERPVYRCLERDCQRERSPFDEELGLEPKEHYTPPMQDKIAWAGTSSFSFQRASRDLEKQLERAICPKQIHRVTEKIGQRALALQDEEVKLRGAPASLEAPIPTTEQPETVVIEMDGTCAMGRDGEGHEVKCATVFGLDTRRTTGSPGKERPVLLRRGYCATSLGIRAFGAMVWAMASWWGVRSARRIVVLGDGIDWIWNDSRDRLHFTLPDGARFVPVEIVDFWHACENLAKARDLIYADRESAPAKAWFELWCHRLRHEDGAVEALIRELAKRAKAVAEDEARRGALDVRTNYFRTHRARMRYAEFEALGLPIGSGAIEGTCKNLIKGRLDGVGMRWDAAEGIELMTALRVRLFNERWEDLWEQDLRQAA
jgi:hypothetical protein